MMGTEGKTAWIARKCLVASVGNRMVNTHCTDQEKVADTDQEKVADTAQIGGIGMRESDDSGLMKMGGHNPVDDQVNTGNISCLADLPLQHNQHINRRPSYLPTNTIHNYRTFGFHHIIAIPNADFKLQTQSRSPYHHLMVAVQTQVLPIHQATNTIASPSQNNGGSTNTGLTTTP